MDDIRDVDLIEVSYTGGYWNKYLKEVGCSKHRFVMGATYNDGSEALEKACTYQHQNGKDDRNEIQTGRDNVESGISAPSFRIYTGHGYLDVEGYQRMLRKGSEVV